MTPIAVVTTVATRADAEALARAIVEAKLAACAQIEPIESFYVWDGALQHEPEQRVTFKTVAERWEAIRAAIVARHPYELPAIHANAFAAVHEPYAAWIAEHSLGAAAR